MFVRDSVSSLQMSPVTDFQWSSFALLNLQRFLFTDVENFLRQSRDYFTPVFKKLVSVKVNPSCLISKGYSVCTLLLPFISGKTARGRLDEK